MPVHPEMPRQPRQVCELRVEIHVRFGKSSELYFVCVPPSVQPSSRFPLYIRSPVHTHASEAKSMPMTTLQTRISISLLLSQSPTTSLVARTSSLTSSSRTTTSLTAAQPCQRRLSRAQRPKLMMRLCRGMSFFLLSALCIEMIRRVCFIAD